MLKVGDRLICRVNALHLREGTIYTIDYIEPRKDDMPIIGFTETFGMYGFHPSFFIIATELTEALT